MIFFVDEDHRAFAGWIAELGLRRHRVVTHSNASDAFRDLWRGSVAEVDAVLVDVMLAPGDDLSTFPDDSTIVGLHLLRALCQQNAAVFPARAIIMTNAIGAPLKAAIEFGAALGVPVWDKRSVTSPVHFADKVENFMAPKRDL